MVSIRAVAKKAGVGAGTVSRALNGSGYVSEETKKRILKVVEELDYKPNELAKNLARNRSGIIGVMVPDLEHPFFARIMRYMETELFRKDYKCLVCNTLGIMNRQGGFMEMLERNTVDGIITCVDALPGDKDLRGKPVVAMDRDWGKGIPIVRSDHKEGGKLAAQQFLKSGCKHVIQFFPSDKIDQPSTIRNVVIKEILTKNGCCVTNIDTRWDAMSYEYNRSVMWKYMDMLDDFDGVLSNDIGATSCLAVAKKRGIDVPGELKIIAYDGTELTNIIYPQLTAVVQDCEQIARKCVLTILAMIEGDVPIENEILLPVKWQAGETV